MIKNGTMIVVCDRDGVEETFDAKSQIPGTWADANGLGATFASVQLIIRHLCPACSALPVGQITMEIAKRSELEFQLREQMNQGQDMTGVMFPTDLYPLWVDHMNSVFHVELPSQSV